MKLEAPLLNLFCNEDIFPLNANLGEEDDEILDFVSVSEADCDFIENSFQKETAFGAITIDEKQPKTCRRSERLEAVKWILKTRTMFGYHHGTAYLSLIYFDMFLAKACSSEDKSKWSSQILSIACLSLAAKMEESNARSLIEYRVEGYDFQGNNIKKIELRILHELQWKMGILTPFAYLNYFTTKFCIEISGRQEIATRAEDLVLAIVEEINAAENRPSIVAAASVLAAYDHRMEKTTLEDKIDAIPSWGPPEKELTFSCYCVLQEMMLRTPISAVIPTVLPVKDSAVASKGGSKRSLNFEDKDPNHRPKKS